MAKRIPTKYDDENQEELGRRMKIARMQCGLSQNAAGILLGGIEHPIAQANIALWESGKRIPGKKTLQNCAEKYQVDYDWLAYGDTTIFSVGETDGHRKISVTLGGKSNQPEKISSKKLYDEYQSLSSEDQMIVLNAIRALKIDTNSEEYQKYEAGRDKAFSDELAKIHAELESNSKANNEEYKEARIWAVRIYTLPEEYKKYKRGQIDLDTLDRLVAEKLGSSDLAKI